MGGEWMNLENELGENISLSITNGKVEPISAALYTHKPFLL